MPLLPLTPAERYIQQLEEIDREAEHLKRLARQEYAATLPRPKSSKERAADNLRQIELMVEKAKRLGEKR